MATTGIINTKLMKLYTGTSPGTAITCQTDASLSVTNETRDITCKDSGQWKEALYAQTSWEISGSALVSWDGANSAEEISNFVLTQASTTVAFKTGVSGDPIWSGSVLWTSFEISSPGTNENVTMSFTGMGTGTLTYAAS
jgi:predicted secreted protein